MKVCPKCARSFAEALRYCPHDATELVKYDLRADLHRRGELQFLISTESLLARLRRECLEAVYEFKHNPKSFLAGLLRGEGSHRRRKQMLQVGMASAVIAYSTLMMAGILIGLFTASPQSSEARFINDPTLSDEPVFVAPVFNPKVTAKSTTNSAGKLGGSFQPKQDSGGGGGANDNSPSRAGTPPQATMSNQILPPDLRPRNDNATLIVPMTVVADPNAFLKYKGPMGDWRGIGQDDSLGNGGKNGIGNSPGDGYGPGNKFGVGGNDPRFTGGKPSGPGSEVPTMTRDLRPTILFRPRAKYTELARQNRIQGSVILTVVYGADGLIHDIRVQHGLPDGLTEEAIAVAQQIRFNPATRDGKPVSVRGSIEYNFTLY